MLSHRYRKSSLRTRSGVSAAGLILVGLVTINCGPKPAYVDIASMPRPQEKAVVLAPGDVIDVKFFHVPELNETQAIRPDGKIALQLVGEVDVEGRSPQQISDQLSDLYAPHLKKPDVTVIIREYHGRRVFVIGEVLAPGVVSMPGRMSVTEAVMHAGGFNMRTARVNNVVLIRHQDGRRYGASLDMTQTLAGAVSDEFQLEPLDIIYVPRTRIVKVVQWIDQHINQLIPMIGIEYTTLVNDEDTLTIDLTRTQRITR